MRNTLVKNLEARFEAYADLIAETNNDDLQQTLEIEKHKTLAEHLWCIVGARESYARAIAAGQWQGFHCSVTDFTQTGFADKLHDSARGFLRVIRSVEEWTDERETLLATLAEHEVMHEGQIIRHVYGMGGRLPSSWTWA
ncbi:MAG: hypothetical protein ACFHXK_21000 [bacterium]